MQNFCGFGMVATMNTKQSDDFYSSEETSRRRDATIKRMLATPPKPHSEMKVGKPRAKSMTPKRRKAQQNPNR
jgi:hypothetical protein